MTAAPPGVAATTDWKRDVRIVNWTTADGLPQNTINAIVLLANEDLWLATFGGLARFDGYRYTVLDTAADDAMPANRVVSAVRTGDDSFLFLTQQGHLGRVSGGQVSRVLPPPAPNVDLLELQVDRRGRIFCRSTDGRGWFTDREQGWRVIDGMHGELLHDFATDEAGETWGTLDSRLIRLTDGPPVSVTLPEPAVVVFPRRGGGLWLGMPYGLGSFDGTRVSPVEVRPPLPRKIEALESESGGALWVGLSGGISRLEEQADGSWRSIAIDLGLPASVGVRSLRLDAHRSLWVGTVGGGLHRVSLLQSRRYGAESRLGEVSALASDGMGGAFASSGCQRLFRIDPDGRTTEVRLPIEMGTPGGCGVALAAGPQGRVWARVGSRLFVIGRHRLDAEVVIDDLPAEEGPIIANPDRTVWVASRGGSVRLVSEAGSTLRELALPAPIMSASAGQHGDLWLGGDGRVSRVGPTGVEHYGPDADVQRGLVRDILADADGSVWIGTYGGGLGLLRAGRVARLTAQQGLPDNAVSSILDDGRGRLWVSTNRGVAVMERSDLYAVADGRQRTLMPVVLGTERGVDEANFGNPAGAADDAGRLWFGTISGAVAIDTAAFPFNTRPPDVRFESARVDDRALPLGTRLTVPAGTTRVRLAFTAVELRYPELLRFRFRVAGLDAQWVDLGLARTVDWSPPGPGRHRMLVEARNEDGVWSAAPAAIDIDVLPAWWQTTAFRASAVLALAVAVVGSFRWRLRRIERAHALRLHALEEQRRGEEKIASVRAQLEHVSRAALAGELAASLAHEVGQPIGAIVNNAEAGKRHLAQYLRHPEDLEQIFGDIVADGMRAAEVVKGLRGFLQSRGPEAGPIDLSALVREMLPLVRRELQDNRVEIELALSEDLPPVEGFRVQLGQIVVNLVINACEALGQVTGDRRITISTRAKDGHVTLVVCDNGPGLAPDVAARVFEPFVTTKPEGLGVGLAICRSIAERHGGHLRADAVTGGGLGMTLTLPAAPSRVPES